MDRWAKLDAQRQEVRGEQGDLEAEIDEVREAFINVAKREGLELVAGGDKEVVVKQIERIMFPRKSEESEKATEHEAALRTTKWWKDLSTLNAAILRAAWEDAGESDPELLKRFVWTEEATTARLRNRRARKA